MFWLHIRRGLKVGVQVVTTFCFQVPLDGIGSFFQSFQCLIFKQSFEAVNLIRAKTFCACRTIINRRKA